MNFSNRHIAKTISWRLPGTAETILFSWFISGDLNFKAFASNLEINDIQFIPIFALAGDSVVNKPENLEWYKGSTMIYHLETVHISSDYNHVDCRFSIQSVT